MLIFFCWSMCRRRLSLVNFGTQKPFETPVEIKLAMHMLNLSNLLLLVYAYLNSGKFTVWRISFVGVTVNLILACSVLIIFSDSIPYCLYLKFLLQSLEYIPCIVENFQHQIRFLASVLIVASILMYIVEKLKTATQFISWSKVNTWTTL